MRNSISSLLLTMFLLASPVYAAPTTGELLTQANTAWKAGRFDQAEDAFKQAVALAPESSEPYARLGAFYLSRHRAGEAIGQFQDAITHDPQNAKLFVGLAIAYLHQQSYGMAQEMVARALELNPKLANARKLGEYVTAKQQLLAKVHKGANTASPDGRTQK